MFNAESLTSYRCGSTFKNCKENGCIGLFFNRCFFNFYSSSITTLLPDMLKRFTSTDESITDVSRSAGTSETSFDVVTDCLHVATSVAWRTFVHICIHVKVISFHQLPYTEVNNFGNIGRLLQDMYFLFVHIRTRILFVYQISAGAKTIIVQCSIRSKTDSFTVNDTAFLLLVCKSNESCALEDSLHTIAFSSPTFGCDNAPVSVWAVTMNIAL